MGREIWHAVRRVCDTDIYTHDLHTEKVLLEVMCAQTPASCMGFRDIRKELAEHCFKRASM